VLQQAGRRDEGVRVGGEEGELVLHRVAAHQQAEAERRRHKVRQLDAEAVRLQGELSRRGEDGRADANRGRVPLEPLEHRQQERRRLSGAGPRHRDDVLPREDRRDRLALDGSGHAVALAEDGLVHALRQPERAEPATLLPSPRRLALLLVARHVVVVAAVELVRARKLDHGVAAVRRGRREVGALRRALLPLGSRRARRRAHPLHRLWLLWARMRGVWP